MIFRDEVLRKMVTMLVVRNVEKRYMKKDVFIISPNDEKKNLIILYLHGGSYVGELEKYHWNFFKDIIDDTSSTIVVPDYPLAPEYTYVEVFKFMEPLYKEIVGKIDKKTEFVIMGDSAGAGLALALYQRNGKLKNRLPDKTILISPWLDVRMENPEIDNIKDPVLNKSLLKLSDFVVKIPMMNNFNSLNVSTAFSAIIFETVRQKILKSAKVK